MKQLISFFSGAFLFMVGFSMIYSCQKSTMERVFRPKPEVTLRGEVQTGGSQVDRIKLVKLSADTVYLLTENFTRESGEELLIEKGTLIKSNPGVGIYINKGARMLATGTATNPIVFTTNLAPGNANNYWTGITVNGNSVNNVDNVNGDINDNSGSLQYVRIEFGGLRLNSVGAGTTLDHIQTSYSFSAPGFVFNGGTVNSKYLISYACASATDFYLGNGYRGMLQFMLAYRFPFFGPSAINPLSSISGMYIENNAAAPITAVPATSPLISNLTVIGPNGLNGSPSVYKDSGANFYSGALVTTNNAGFKIRNSVFMGFPVGGWQIGDSATARRVHFLDNEFTHSVTYCAVPHRVFYIRRGVYKPYDFRDFKDYMLEDRFDNKVLASINGFGYQYLFEYKENPPLPEAASLLLSGGSFAGTDYSNSFFINVQFIGAVGMENWMKDWTNFNPLKTRYNLPG